MANYKDFDLDLKEIKSGVTGGDEMNAPTRGNICSAIISSIFQGCSENCVTTKCPSDECPVPSRDYGHRSCNGPLNDGTVQINC